MKIVSNYSREEWKKYAINNLIFFGLFFGLLFSFLFLALLPSVEGFIMVAGLIIDEGNAKRLLYQDIDLDSIKDPREIFEVQSMAYDRAEKVIMFFSLYAIGLITTTFMIWLISEVMTKRVCKRFNFVNSEKLKLRFEK